MIGVLLRGRLAHASPLKGLCSVTISLQRNQQNQMGFARCLSNSNVDTPVDDDPVISMPPDLAALFNPQLNITDNLKKQMQQRSFDYIDDPFLNEKYSESQMIQTLQCIELRKKHGPAHSQWISFDAVPLELTKIDIANSCGFELRVLRSIAQADLLEKQSAEQDEITESQKRKIATIVVRPHAIVLHMGALQAIIMSDKLLLFNTKNALMKSIASNFSTMINKTSHTSSASLTHTAFLNFEFRALEALLSQLFGALDQEFQSLHPEVQRIIEGLYVSQMPEQLNELMHVSNWINDFQGRVRKVQTALNELLNSDEDMALMSISDPQKRDILDHNDAELLLEAFAHSASELDNKIISMQSRIRTTEEFLKIHYDSQRNRLMRINLVVGFATLATSICAFGASIFGMNLTNHLEQHPHAFVIVTGSFLMMGGCAFISSYMYYQTTKRLPMVMKFVKKYNSKRLVTHKI